MSEADVALACIAAFVDGLVRQGVAHACVSPGSRSTAPALALARDPAVRVHVHLDERASAFFGLGLAKATGRPVAIVCTSGTAAANLFPAVVEAFMSRVPLIVLTADRPPELRGVGANQTIDQRDLYGRYARYVEAPVPDEPEVATWRNRGGEVATTASATSPPGPVHVNLPLREPLVPSTSPPAPTGTRPCLVHDPSPFVDEHIDLVAAELSGVERGVVHVGGLGRPGAGADVVALAERLGWPVVAEPHSDARVPGALTAAQFLLSNETFAEHHRPDVVLQLGAAPTSRAGLSLAANTERLVIVDPDDVVADPNRRAERRIVSDPRELVPRLLPRVSETSDSGWLEGWRLADAEARSAVDTLLDAWAEPFEGRVARDLADTIPNGATLCVGSSMPIRDLDAFMRPRHGLRVLANRGASGIDGFVSTTLGVAATGAPTYALIGDLTLLHDAGSLLWSARRGHDAVLVVLNNGGGVIFSFLAQRELPELEELFTTPHGLDLGAIAEAARAGHTRVERAADLVPAVERAAGAGGVHLVEVVVDLEVNVRRHAEVHDAVALALGHTM